MSRVMTDRAPHHRITVDEYYRMAEDGKLDPNARVELIEGEIIEMAPIGSRHGASSTKLTYLLMRSLGDLALVRVQLPLRLDNYSELALVVPRTDFYKECHPTPADVLFLIEVSDASSSRDRTAKVSLYARHNVPEVWIVDLQRERLHFYRTPREGAYTDVSFTAKPGVIALAAPSGITVD